MWMAGIVMVFVMFFVSYMLAQQLLGYCLGMGAIDRLERLLERLVTDSLERGLQ
jgi:hypothetical protein